MQTLDQLLAEIPILADMDPVQLELVSHCGNNVVFAEGAYLMRAGAPANDFFVIRRGDVSIETHAPGRGQLVLETLGPQTLIGWSWLVEPYLVEFDVRALGEVHAIHFDAACLRGRFGEDPVLGYELMRRFTHVMLERLQATRIRLLDLYET